MGEVSERHQRDLLTISGTGARYDGSKAGSSRIGSCNGKSTGTVDALSADDKQNLRKFIEAQLDAYEQHTGKDDSPLVFYRVLLIMKLTHPRLVLLDLADRVLA